MSKRNKIIYWIATIWLCLGMLSSAIVQVLQVKEETEFIINLGYPLYFLTIIGVWKILGVIAVLAPKLPVVKEWAYAGFFIVMSGALFSHLALDRLTMAEIFPPILMIVLTVVSWYFRPPDRKVIELHQQIKTA